MVSHGSMTLLKKQEILTDSQKIKFLLLGCKSLHEQYYNQEIQLSRMASNSVTIEHFVLILMSMLFSSPGANPTSRQDRGLHTLNRTAMWKYWELLCKKLLTLNKLEWCKNITGWPAEFDTIPVTNRVWSCQYRNHLVCTSGRNSHRNLKLWLYLVPNFCRGTLWRHYFKTAKDNKNPYSHLVPSQFNQYGITSIWPIPPLCIISFCIMLYNSNNNCIMINMIL